MFFKLVLPFFLGVASFQLLANSETDLLTKSIKNVGLTFGSFTEFYNAVQIDDSGGQNGHEFNPLLGISGDLKLSGHFILVPEILWVLPRNTSSDKVVENLFALRSDLGYFATDYLKLRIGTSIMINNIRGQGGSKMISNGNSESRFYAPNQSRTAINQTLDFGLDYIYQSFGARFQTYIYSVFKSEQRQVSYALALTYYYDLQG